MSFLVLVLLMADTPDLRKEASISAAKIASQQVDDSPPSESFKQFTPAEKSRWFQPLSKAEWLAQAAFLGLGLTDWGQTVNFTQHPTDNGYESNPILGKHPSRARVNTMIPLGLIGHTLGVWALPRPYRNMLQGAGLVGEGLAVGNNAKQGVRPIAPWK